MTIDIARLDSLSMRAHMVGARVEAVRDDSGWGFWLLEEDSCETVWQDDNLSTSLQELEYKILMLEEDRRDDFE